MQSNLKLYWLRDYIITAVFKPYIIEAAGSPVIFYKSGCFYNKEYLGG